MAFPRFNNRIPISLILPPSKEVLEQIAKAHEAANPVAVKSRVKKSVDKEDVASKILTVIWFGVVLVATAMAFDTLGKNFERPDMKIAVYLPVLTLTLFWVILSKASYLEKALAVLGCAGLLFIDGQIYHLLSVENGMYSNLTLAFLAVWALMVRYVGYGIVKSNNKTVIDPKDPLRSFGKAKQLGLLTSGYVLVLCCFYQVLKAYSSEPITLAGVVGHPFGVALTAAFLTSIVISGLFVRYLTIGGGFRYVFLFGLFGYLTFSGVGYSWLNQMSQSVDQNVRRSDDLARIERWDDFLGKISPFYEVVVAYWQPIYLFAALLLCFLITFRWLGFRIDAR
ncbi:MAG: hypothetical protein RLY14_1940 [Planctomycetota bacterium]|jgi:hypothetical protein